MAKQKKELKTVDLDDLQSSDPSEEISHEEEVISPKISVEELDKRKKTAPALVPKNKTVEGKVHSGVSDRVRRERKRQLDHLTSKYRFDRKEYNVKALLTIALLFGFGYLATHSEERLPFVIGISWIRIYGSYYPLICLLMLFAIPLKVKSQTMFEVFYEGMTLPSELFPVGRSTRRRVLWKDIQSLDFKRKHNVPFVQLLDKKGKLLGEMRLDVDNPKGLYKVLDRYVPKEHILRKLFNN